MAEAEGLAAPRQEDGQRHDHDEAAYLRGDPARQVVDVDAPPSVMMVVMMTGLMAAAGPLRICVSPPRRTVTVARQRAFGQHRSVRWLTRVTFSLRFAKAVADRLRTKKSVTLISGVRNNMSRM